MTDIPDWLHTNVSRETIEDLQRFVHLIAKWNPSINLVSKSSLTDIWERHIWDAVQIIDFVGYSTEWADLGSGGGFPGIVLATLAKHSHPEMRVTLVESDQRKSTFLRTAIRELSLNATVLAERIEAVESLNASRVSARALADLDQLLGYGYQHVADGGICIFPKGQSWEKEISDAKRNWSFSFEAHKSKTSPNSAILTIKDILRV